MATVSSLLLLFLLPWVATAAVAPAVPTPPRECLAVTQTKITWAWPPLVLTVLVWADPDTPDAHILQVTLPDPSRPREIALHAEGITEKVLEEETEEDWGEGRLGPGWVELRLAISDNVTLSTAGKDGRHLLSRPLPRHLHDLHLAGSNLTVDCSSGQVVWRVGGEWLGVPLARERHGDGQPFLLYPYHAILPSFGFPGRKKILTLGWDRHHARLHAFTHRGALTIAARKNTTSEAFNNTPVAASLQPLPPSTAYLLRLVCRDVGVAGKRVLCQLKDEREGGEGRLLGTLRAPAAPWVMRVRGEDQGSFFLQQDITDSLPPTPTHRQHLAPAPYTAPSPPPPSEAQDENHLAGNESLITPSKNVSSPDSAQPSPTPKATPTDSTTGGGSSGHVNDKVMGWSGWWVILTVLLAILLVFVIIMCFVSHYHRPKLEKYLGGLHLIPESSMEDLLELERPLYQQDRRPNLLRSVSIVNTEDPNAAPAFRLWNAVASGDEVEVKQVMASLSPNPNSNLAGQDTTPYQEAHHRGHSPVLRVLEAAMDKRPDVPHNDMVLSILQAHAKKVEAVFEAARGGQYRHAGGVDVLLRAYSLPGTLHDHQGRSLLHYAAFVQLADGAPLWLAQDVRSLVESHGVLMNAVDFKGCTALHILVEYAKNSENITCWDGKTLSVSEAWLCLASLLMEVGCDPRLLDHHHRSPHQLTAAAQNPPLKALLSKAADNLGTTDTCPSLEKFPEVVQASARGDETALRKLLQDGAKVLPLGGRRDPLLEAVRGGHRNIVFLLLSAGAPLCAHGLLGNTPFEAAHRTLGLPALFPALIRKEFCDRLQEELEVLSASDRQHATTVEGLVQLKTIAEVSGHRLGEQLKTWRDRRSSTSFGYSTDALTQAASLGLTLTCQLLGVAGVPLHPLPNLPHPLARALGHYHYHTAYSLCRDLKMNPYSAGVSANVVPEQLLADLMESELKKIDKKLRKKGIGAVAAEDLLERIRGKHNTPTLKQLQTVMYLLAELNLVTLLHQMRQRILDLDFNMRVHTASASTMLHVAAAHGKIAMVEYLLSRGADQKRLTRGGLTPSHLAALRGHAECIEYLVGCSRAEPECGWGLSPSQLLEHFNDNMKSRHLDLLTHQEALAIMGTSGELAKAQLILAGRCAKLGITSPGSLWLMLEDEESRIKAFISKELEESVLCDIKELCQQIEEKDERFCGKVVSYPLMREKMDLLLPDNFEFYLELEEYSGLEEGSINVVNGNDSPKGYVSKITTTKDQGLFTGENFINTFRRVAQEALSATTFTTLTLVPPFLAHTPGGVCLHVALKCPMQVVLVRVMLTPVIKITVPKWISLEHLSGEKQVQPENNLIFQVHLAAGPDGRWMFLFNHLVEWVVSHGEEYKWRVLQACFYFTKLLETCWWLPKKVTRDYGMTWHIIPIGVAVPHTTTLQLHFMEELLGEGRDAWTKDQWFARLVAVVRRASFPVSVESTPDDLKPTSAMQATLQFLMELQNNVIQATVT